MEWENQPPPEKNGCGVNNGGLVVKVMTDEQVEVIRKQIAVYATICKQLVELHKSFASQHDLEVPFSPQYLRTTLEAYTGAASDS